MKFNKEAWWEYLRETDLKDLPSDEGLLDAMKQVFYCGYICKESENAIINNELERISQLRKSENKCEGFV